ncbi:hypothetical protein ABIE51_000388 [Lysobacter sp. OAE881]|uniref:transglutaminase-like domain-containing protein n=1 Tax=Lysobacter sp. OAE881 TaxID=2663813 RepID=UPI00178BDAE0
MMSKWRARVLSACIASLLALAAFTAGAREPDEAQARAFVQSLLVASPYRIGAAARDGEILYRLRFADGIARQFPSTAEQAVRIDGDALDVSVCRDCRYEERDAASDLTRYLTPNAWVDSDQRSILAFARLHARGGSVDARMTRLVGAIRMRMDGPVDFRSYLPASAALRDRGGDCTEFALLLAATGRAVGIPTRVVHGLAYSSRFVGQPHVFGPHSWVQAWDGGHWRSYDAGLERFDAGHIALRIGDGTPAELAGLADVLRQVRIVEAVGVRGNAASARTR